MAEEITAEAVSTEAPESISEEIAEPQADQVEAVEAPQSTPTGQSEEPSFFDPNTVPQELLPAYKQMQAAFTKKTQEIAATRKEAEALKAKAEAFAKYEQYVPIFEEMISSQAQAQQTVNPELQQLENDLKAQGYDDAAIDLIKAGFQASLKAFNRDVQAKEAQAKQMQEQQRFTSEVKKAESLDARLNDESLVYTGEDGETFTFGEVVANIAMSYQDWTKDPVLATKRAIARVDSLIGKAKVEGKQELSDSARNKAAKFPSTSSSPQSAVSNAQPKSIREAYELTLKELS